MPKYVLLYKIKSYKSILSYKFYLFWYKDLITINFNVKSRFFS